MDMKLHRWAAACLLSISLPSLGANCPASTDSTTAGNGTCDVVGSESTFRLNFNSGFDDATAISATGGNSGTTIGAQRKLSFIKAAEILADQVTSSQVIIVDANFSLLSCDASSATLGSAGASANLAYGSPAPAGFEANTFYPIGLMNAISNSDIDAGVSDVTAQFNSNIGNTGCLQASDGWYYGYDNPPANSIGFTTVLLHEMTHGLGFASLVSASTGAKASGLDDIFSNHLYDAANSRTFNDASESDANRAAAAISGTGLLWAGTNVNTQAVGLLTAGFQDNDSSGTFTSGDRVQMYAPNPVEGGSSVSHFNTSASPNELMEPSYTEGTLSIGLALYLLQDIGWGISAPAANNAPTLTAVDQSTNEDTALTGVDASGWASDADGDTLSFSISSCPANITCSINTNGTGLSLTPASDYNGATNSVEITVSDGNGGSVSDTFNLTVTSVNDAPSWSTISNQTITIGAGATDIDLSSFSSDVEGNSLSYSVVSCGTGLNCSISSATLSLTAVSNAGATVAVEVQANDSQGANNTANTSFNVTISAAANNAPTLTAVDQSTNEDTALTGVDASGWASDADGDTLNFSVSSCPANITCSINTNGTGLSLTPASDYNGATNSVEITVSDGNGSSVSDTFNLTVTSVNDAPTWSTLPNPSITVGDSLDIDLSAYSSDIESNALSYSVVSCGTGLDCVISSNTLTLTATANGGNTVAVEVQANDGQASQNTQNASLAVSIESASQPPVLTLGGSTLLENTEYDISLETTSVSISGATSNYSVSLSLDGISRPDLIDDLSTSFSIKMPTSGQFAGEYDVTVFDGVSMESYTYLFKRSPRVTLSHASLMSGQTGERLSIEGAASGTVVTLSSDESAVGFTDDAGASITELTVSNDPDRFNASHAYLTISTVVAETEVALTASSTYGDQVENGTVYPSWAYTFTITDQTNASLASAAMTISNDLSAFGLEQTHNADSTGVIELLLPDMGATLSATVSASGYENQSVTLDGAQLAQTIVMSEIIDPFNLRGSITALAPLSFVSELPTVTAVLADDTEIDLTVTKVSNSLAQFDHTHDLNLGAVSQLIIRHSEGIELVFNINTRSTTLVFDVFLESQTQVVTNEDSSTPASGALGGWWLIMSLLFIRRLAKGRY